MNFYSKLVLASSLLLIGGCQTLDPTAGRTFNVKDKQSCVTICKQAEMDFQALVVVAGMTGCVCEVRGGSKSSSTGAVMGGAMAAVMAQQQQQQQQASSPPPR